MDKSIPNSDWLGIKNNLARRIREVRLGTLWRTWRSAACRSSRGSFSDLAQLRERLHDPRNLDPSLHRADQDESALAPDRLWRQVFEVARNRLISLEAGLSMACSCNRGRARYCPARACEDASGLSPGTAQDASFQRHDRGCFRPDVSQWPTTEAGRAGSLVFHKRILPLWSHEARVLPSGEKATALIRSVCPRRA